MPATTAPIATKSRYRNGEFVKATTKIPPCGASNLMPAKPTNPPANADPATKLGIARAGSAAANGMAP